MNWAYGVTTVPERLTNLTLRTLLSLAGGGFPKPRLFVDGCNDPKPIAEKFNLEVTVRFPSLRTYGNWVLALWELYVREPQADRYILFQDDIVTYKHLREYLETILYPENGYCNLYLFPQNEKRHKGEKGWYLSNQRGKSACALMFDKAAVIALLSAKLTVEKPQNLHRGWKSIDGSIVTAMSNVGFKEYVHCPSLIQHTGTNSSMGNKKHPLAKTFKGEQFDAMKLI